MTTNSIVFIDTETTGLATGGRDDRMWEVAAIARPGMPWRNAGHDVAYHWFVDARDLRIEHADPRALAVGRFDERHPARCPGALVGETRESHMLADLIRITAGATVCCANPAFDMIRFVERRAIAHGMTPAWHHDLLDVTAFAAGARALVPPLRFAAALGAFGITVPPGGRHTAMGDAIAARDLYDAVLGRSR